MLVWLNNWTNIFLLAAPIVKQLLDFSKTRKLQQKLGSRLALHFYFVVMAALLWSRSQAIFDKLVVDKCEV